MRFKVNVFGGELVDEAVYFALHHSRRSLLRDGPILREMLVLVLGLR